MADLGARRWAVRAVVDRLEGQRQEPRETVLRPRLVVRGTTARAQNPAPERSVS